MLNKGPAAHQQLFLPKVGKSDFEPCEKLRESVITMLLLGG